MGTYYKYVHFKAVLSSCNSYDILTLVYDVLIDNIVSTIVLDSHRLMYYIG